MNTVIGNLFGHWQTTLLGAGLALATYFAAQPGAWGLLGAIGVAALGAVARDPGK